MRRRSFIRGMLGAILAVKLALPLGEINPAIIYGSGEVLTLEILRRAVKTLRDASVLPIPGKPKYAFLYYKEES